MAQDRVENDLLVTGTLTCRALGVNTATITNAMVHATADVDASKLEHQYQHVVADAYATSATSYRKLIHDVRGATGTLLEFRCRASQANVGDSTVTIQLKKNGSNILSASVSFSSADAAFALKTGTFTSTALVADDYLEVDITATVGTGTLAKGMIISLALREDAE